MSIQATGRATFTKVIDGVSGVFTLVPTYGSQVKSKDPQTWAPDFSSNINYITPTLKILGIGTTANQIKKTCTWTINGNAINGTTEVAESTGAYRLKISHNLDSSALIECRYTWTHPSTGQNVEFVATLPIPVAENAGTMIMAMITPKTIDRFQTTAGNSDTLTFEGAMIRGGKEDTTDVTYKWQIFAPGKGAYVDIPDNGQLTDAETGLPTGKTLFTSGTNKKTSTVDSRAVVHVGGSKLIVTDTDKTSTTYQSTAEYVKSLIDDTDPIEMDLVQLDGTQMSAGSNGNRMKFVVSQGNYEWSTTDYVNKTISFYRETTGGEKDATFAPASTDFSDWTIDPTNHVVKRTFTADEKTNGSDDHRTVKIQYKHLLVSAVQTSFASTLDFD